MLPSCFHKYQGYKSIYWSLNFQHFNCLSITRANMIRLLSSLAQDFYNLVDVYLDAVFFPRCVEDFQTFQQEGWHFELNDPSEDISYKGRINVVIIYFNLFRPFSICLALIFWAYLIFSFCLLLSLPLFFSFFPGDNSLSLFLMLIFWYSRCCF